ncbi:hypothetical protein U27_01987 [Candidatus Vecturithrix granuli]|uniref:Uncharacterized protein n=1 Tax=Vecturithrix granuli TaxID=1499967 RepID=A0A0S6W9Y1_VECG1|nr:hypothetical protein U27_01987 [Candidatus Vecturithrix granuli]
MINTVIERNELKGLLKESLLELLEERRDVFYDLIAEVFEDLAMVKAIQEGINTPSVPREDIFAILEGRA